MTVRTVVTDIYNERTKMSNKLRQAALQAMRDRPLLSLALMPDSSPVCLIHALKAGTPTSWGHALAFIAKHLSKSFAREGGYDQATAFEEIVAAFHAEIAQSTGDVHELTRPLPATEQGVVVMPSTGDES